MAHVDNDLWRGVCTFYHKRSTNTPLRLGRIGFADGSANSPRNSRQGFPRCRAKRWKDQVCWRTHAERATDPADGIRLREFSEQIRTADNDQINEIAHLGELEVLMATYPDRTDASQYAPRRV